MTVGLLLAARSDSGAMATFTPTLASAAVLAGLQEGPAWEGVNGTWQPLYGRFFDRGFSVEWHDFHVDQKFDWGRSFHSDSVEICLNFGGVAQMHDGAQDTELQPSELAIYGTQSDRIRANRDAGCIHRFLTLEVSSDFLATQFRDVFSHLKKPVQKLVDGKPSVFLERQALHSSLLSARAQFMEPPVSAPARDPWYFGKVLAVVSQVLFAEAEPELFCERHRRTNRERVEHVQYLIGRDLENPPSLEMLATAVNCSPYYLSRMFAQETGVSIPKYLRVRRIEKAAALIAEGTTRVTDAAMAVGYSSLSAFNRAFVEHFGCCPGLYPNAHLKCTATAKAARKSARSRGSV